jgi:hypothetical protein
MEGEAKMRELIEEGLKVPRDPRAKKRLEELVERGEFEAIDPAAALSSRPRYLVTFMKSVTAFRIRSGTVVTVTNQASRPNLVSVSYFLGFTDNTSPVGVTSFVIPPDFSVDFATRNLPDALTATNSVPSPELIFDEGRAIVSSRLPQIGVSSRIYYTVGDGDEELLAITDSKVVRFGQANKGD